MGKEFSVDMGRSEMRFLLTWARGFYVDMDRAERGFS
jgi:hypothetical protein